VLHNLMMADRILSLGLLAAGLSHHIRNALVAVKTFLDLAPAKMQAEKGPGDTLRHPEFWNDYHHNAQTQVHKINDLLSDLGSAAEDASSLFSDDVAIRDVVAQVVQSAREELTTRNVLVRNEIAPGLLLRQVDRTRLLRLFQLLLKDELISLPAESTVWFTARSLAATPQLPEQVEIQMKDNGPGLPKQSVRLLFDPFVVRTESPTEHGINLMACYFIVHQHGGRIWADAGEGQGGTTFTLQIPVQGRGAPPTRQPPEFLQKLTLNEALWARLSSE